MRQFISKYKKPLSIIISFLIMASVLGWKISLIMIGIVSWHESGHLYASRKLGYRTDGFIMLPFIGGMSFSDISAATVYEKSIVYLAGPISGLVISIATFVLGVVLHNNYMFAVCLINSIMNMFNLIPLGGLDGGGFIQCIFSTIHPKINQWFKIFSCVALSTLFLIIHAPALLLMIGFSILDCGTKNPYYGYQFDFNKTMKHITAYFSIMTIYVIIIHYCPGLDLVFNVLK